MRRIIPLVIAVALQAPAEGQTAAPQRAPKVKITLIKTWASKKDNPDALPRELTRYEKALRESTRKNSFRLEEKPLDRQVASGEATEFELPEDYLLSITPAEEGEGKRREWVLKFRLTCKKKKDWVSEVKIRKQPAIIRSPVRKGAEDLILILVFEPPGKS